MLDRLKTGGSMYTIKDIARAANVSPSTVSLVLNNSNKVKLETREKVWKLVKEYNYIPNQFARSLITKQKKIIAAVSIINKRSMRVRTFDSVGDTYLLDLLPGIEEEINKTDYSLLLDELYLHDSKFSEIINPNRVDGILLAGGFISDSLAETILHSKIPTVLVGANHPAFDCVNTDSKLGIYLATRHLLELGHRNIFFINSSPKSQSYELKLKGYMKAMSERPVSYQEDWISSSDFSGQAGYEVFSGMWKKGTRPTAIVTGYDGIGLGVVRFLYEKGVKCPDDISVTGFEDGLLAEYGIPALTTIRIFKEQLGMKALQVLFDRIENPKSAHVNMIINPELIVRGSTARLP